MAKSIDEKRKPAGKDSKIACAAMIGYGKNIIEGEFGLEDVTYGKKSSPLSTELTTGVTISVANGGNPKRTAESR